MTMTMTMTMTMMTTNNNKKKLRHNVSNTVRELLAPPVVSGGTNRRLPNNKGNRPTFSTAVIT